MVRVTLENVKEYYPNAINFHVRKGIFISSPYRINFWVNDVLYMIPKLEFKDSELQKAQSICNDLNFPSA
jgi:hypothetical protein